MAGTKFSNCIFCDIDFSEAIGLSEVEFDNCAFQIGNSVKGETQFMLTEKVENGNATRAVKDLYPDLNVVPVDYDPSATRVNQENRIKLMLATAREKLNRNA